MTPDVVVAYARECLETPFRHQGRIVGLAMDCAGVVVHVAKRLGYDPIEPTAYGRSPSGGMLESAADSQSFLVRVKNSDMQAGDILIMRFAGDPQHFGIYTGENVIHGYLSAGKVVENRVDSKWQKRIVRVYRFKDIK